MAPITYTYLLLFTLSVGTGTHSLKKDYGLPVKVTDSTAEKQTPGPLALQSPKNHLQKRDINTGNILQGPRNRTIFEGLTVSFTCTGNAAVDTIVWNINHFLNISTHIDSGLTVSTLFMAAHLQYNGIVIWCSAVCGGELCGRSESATLTVMRTSSITLGPENQTQFEGSLVVFSCEGSVDDFTWHITGPAQYINIPSRPTASGLTVSTMVLMAHREYNLSRVRCEAICGGELCGRSEEAVLTVNSNILQGPEDQDVSQGSIVTFICVGDTSVDDLTWQTEGQGQYITITTYRESGLLVSNLLMTAHPGYNLTTVSCTAICGSALCGRSTGRLTVLGLYVGLSENLPSTLYYHGGDCTWTLSGIIGGRDFVFNAPHLVLENLDTGVEILCEINETVLLHAVVAQHDEIPSPHNVTLDTINKRLQWDHPFLPQLPPLFELVHGFTIIFQVYGTGSGMPFLSRKVTYNYLDLTTEPIKHCVEYEFVVQAVSNMSEVPSQNSSAVSGNFSVGVPSFRNLSAIINTTHQQNLHLSIHVQFVLEEKDCPGTHPTFFIVNLRTLGEYRFNINSTHVDAGEEILFISLADSIPNTCHLGTIFGGNEVGNCTAYEIQCTTDCSSTVISKSNMATSSAVDALSSPSPPQKYPDGNRPSYIIGAVAGCAAFLIAVIVLGVAVALVGLCIKHHKTGHHVDPLMQTNQAYVTVVRSSRKIKTQPCPAYELAVIEDRV